MTDEQLDAIYQENDRLMKAGDFEALDSILKLQLSSRDDDKLLAHLVSTLPANSKLPSRELLFHHAKRVFLIKYGMDVTVELLMGLAGSSY